MCGACACRGRYLQQLPSSLAASARHRKDILERCRGRLQQLPRMYTGRTSRPRRRTRSSCAVVPSRHNQRCAKPHAVRIPWRTRGAACALWRCSSVRRRARETSTSVICESAPSRTPRCSAEHTAYGNATRGEQCCLLAALTYTVRAVRQSTSLPEPHHSLCPVYGTGWIREVETGKQKLQPGFGPVSSTVL